MTQGVAIETTENMPTVSEQEILEWLKAHPPHGETVIDFHDHTIPGYRLIRELGQGAMSTVYLAEQITLKRLVAIKISRFTQRQAHDWQRFQREAEILSQLPHPGVLKVIDSGLLENQRPYFVTEWCPGGHVGQRLHGQPLTPRAAATIVASVCDILEVVHQADIIHRDLKPSNILVIEKEEIPLERCTLRIADFGLARQITLDQRATLTHTTMGTPGYSAPEQWNDAKIADHRADIYSMGALLYELLTGRPPFQAASPLSAIKCILHEDPIKPRLLQPGIDASLEAVCLKCLEKSPRDRYESAAELAADLRRFLNHEPVQAKPPGPAKQVSHWIRKHPVLSITSLAAGALLVLGLLSLWKVTLSEERSRSHEELAKQAEYFRLMATIRERVAKPLIGWTQANLHDIEKARSLQFDGTDQRELKREFIRASLAFDLAKRADYRNQKLGEIATIAWHPTQPWLAIGYIKAVGNNTNVIEILEIPTMKVVHRLEWPVETTGFGGNVKKNQDGVRSLAWNQDGTILLAGTRSGALQQFAFIAHTPLRQCLGHIPDSLARLLCTGNGKYILANSSFPPWDNRLYRWGKTVSIPEIIYESDIPISNLIALPNSSRVAILRQDTSIVEIDTDNPHVLPNNQHVLYGMSIDSLQGKSLKGNSLDRWLRDYGFNHIPLRQIENMSLITQLNSNLPNHLPLEERMLHTRTSISPLWMKDQKHTIFQRPNSQHIDFQEYASDCRTLSTSLITTKQDKIQFDYQHHSRWLGCKLLDSLTVFQCNKPSRDYVNLHTESLIEFEMSEDGTQRAVFDGTQAMMQTDIHGYSIPMPSISNPSHQNQSIACNPTQPQVALMHQNVIKIWDYVLQKERLFNSKQRRIDLAYSPDGVLWVSGKEQMESIDQQQRIRTYTMIAKEYRSIKVSDRWLLGLYQSGKYIDVFERTGTTDLKLKHVWTNDEPGESMTLDSNHTQLALGTRTGSVVIRQIPVGKFVRTLPACHREVITSIDWKGNTIATGGQDHWIRLWEETDGQWQPTLEWEARGEIVKQKMTADAKQLFALVQGEFALRTFDITSIRSMLQKDGWIK